MPQSGGAAVRRGLCTGGCVWRGPFWEALSGEDATQSHDPSLPAGQAWGHWAPGWPRTRFRASHRLSSGVQTSSRPQSPSVTWGVRGHGPRDPGLRPLKGEMKPVCPGGAAGPYAAPRSVSPAPAARTLSASQYGCREPRARGGGAGGRVWGERLLQAVWQWLLPRRGHVPHVPSWPAAAASRQNIIPSHPLPGLYPGGTRPAQCGSGPPPAQPELQGSHGGGGGRQWPDGAQGPSAPSHPLP